MPFPVLVFPLLSNAGGKQLIWSHSFSFRLYVKTVDTQTGTIGLWICSTLIIPQFLLTFKILPGRAPAVVLNFRWVYGMVFSSGERIPGAPSCRFSTTPHEWASLCLSFRAVLLCQNMKPAVRATSFQCCWHQTTWKSSFITQEAILLMRTSQCLVLLSALTSEWGLWFLLCFVTVSSVNMHFPEDFNFQSFEISKQQYFSHWLQWGMEMDNPRFLLKYIQEVLEGLTRYPGLAGTREIPTVTEWAIYC